MSEMRCHCGDCGKSSFWSRSRRVKRFAQILVWRGDSQVFVTVKKD